MPNHDPMPNLDSKVSQYPMTVALFGPLRPSPQLRRRTQRVIKANVNDHDYFTEITLSESRRWGSMQVEFYVTSTSLPAAQRAGMVYLSQLCDLLSTVTRCPVKYVEDNEEGRDERTRQARETMRVDRTLTEDEWLWVTGSLVALRREHPAYLAAASWYRKGLLSRDCLDGLCCYWRVLERIAEGYVENNRLAKSDRNATGRIALLTADLFGVDKGPPLLHDAERFKKIKKMRNDISHGNNPITLDLIEAASAELEALEATAFAVLDRLRGERLSFEEPAGDE